MAFLTSKFEVSSHTIATLHEARTPSDLAPALFKMVAEALPQQLLVLMLRPDESELRPHSSRPEFQYMCDQYAVDGHDHDVWYQRSPKSPKVPIVRHSLYTPRAELHKSVFYRNVLGKIGCEFGASLVAWQRSVWLGSLTIFRTQAQGDFLDEELAVLRSCHTHFQSIVKRMAILNEERLACQSLETVVWSLPTSAVIFDWELKPIYSNALGHELAAEWKMSVRSTPTKRSRPVSIPHEISDVIKLQRARVAQMKTNSPGTPNMVHLVTLQHGQNKSLSAEISFLPSKSLTFSKGTFLVAFHRRDETPSARDGFDRFCTLSRREREVAQLASIGKNSAEIAKKLGTSGITVRTQLTKAYRKLGVHSRYQLMNLFTEIAKSGLDIGLH